MRYFCYRDEGRRNVILDHPTINGIDFVEVDDTQKTLSVHLINPIAEATERLQTSFRILGGERIANIVIAGVTPRTEEGQTATRHFDVTVDRFGDFSTYTLSVEAPLSADFDPLFSAVDFSFKIHCEADLDCRPSFTYLYADMVEPEIDYLAKDYASFRRLMLDRLALLMPEEGEPNAADLSIALVEMLAYVGDHLSYRQDALGTEAYLHTARRRVSVRRHARLLDYYMHDGANARAWVQIQVNSNRGVHIPQGTKLLTRLSENQGPVVREQEVAAVLPQGPEVFETMNDAVMYEALNEMRFYTWGAADCCLAQGAVKASLRGKLEHLKPGDVLIFKEAKGPQTGVEADADPLKRHAVRLIHVNPEAKDDLYDRLPVTQIEWHPADAMPFPFRISTETAGDVTTAHGNIVLADHGWRIYGEDIGTVPQINPVLSVATESNDPCEPANELTVPPRFRPMLPKQPITCAAACKLMEEKGKLLSAQRMIARDMEDNLPSITLTDSNGEVWQAQRQLLNSDELAEDFVVETESDGRSFIRFGDGIYGRRPAPGAAFTADYRIGNGRQGNVGAGTIAHIVYELLPVSQPSASLHQFVPEEIVAVTNPLGASGGVDPDDIESVRRKVPYAYRRQERAVTTQDYGTMAERHPDVQKAVARLRWTGSWHTVFLAVDREGRMEVDEDFTRDLLRHLERYRMAGHDIKIESPRYVSLQVIMKVCVAPDQARHSIHEALHAVFSNRQLGDGRFGFFHPDNFTFGQPVHLSRLYAVAATVPGIESVRVTEFRRQDCTTDTEGALKEGQVDIGPQEIARLDNNPNYPGHGIFVLDLEGGR